MSYRILCCIFLLVMSFCVPVSAATLGNYTTIDVWTQQTGSIQFEDVTIVSYNSISDNQVEAISNIEFYNIRPGTYEFTLVQANGDSHTGQIIYNTSGILGTSADWTLALDGNSCSWDTIVNADVFGKVFIATYAQNIDTNEKGLIIMDAWGGQKIIGLITGQYNCVFSPDPTITTYPISQIDVTGSAPFSLQVSYGSYDDISAELQKEDVNFWTWINNLLSFVGNVGGILFMIMAAFKFIVIDHFFSLVVLYEVMIMAYAASNSRDIFSFVKKMFRYNRSLFEAILGLIMVIINIFHRLIDVLKP